MALAWKGRHTVVLGYWISVQNSNEQEVDELRAVLLPASVHAGAGQHRDISCPVIIDFARGIDAWSKAVKLLHPGDIVMVDWSDTVGYPGQSRAAEVRLRRGSSTLMTVLLSGRAETNRV